MSIYIGIKGNDRSMTREEYYRIRKQVRKALYENKHEIRKVIIDKFMYGTAAFRINRGLKVQRVDPSILYFDVK